MMQNVYYGFNDRTRSPVGATTLDILASVGTSTSPTTATTKKIALPFEVKAFLPFGALLASDSASTGLNLGFGATDGTVNASIAASSINGVTTSNTDRRHVGNKSFTIITDGTTTEEASQSLIESDGLTLNWSTASATAYILNHIALGGADLEVSLTQHQMNATNAPQSFAHGLSGAPTGVLFFSGSNATAPPNTSAVMQMVVGFWSGSVNHCASVYSANGLTTTLTRRLLRSDSCYVFAQTGTGRTMAVGSVDTTNVNVTYPIKVGTQQDYFWMLAIRGAKVQTGTFDCNGSTDSLTISCAGITPKLFMPVFITSGVGSINTVLNTAVMGIGASDGTNNVSCGISDQNGVTTTNARRWQSSTTLVNRDSGGGLQFEGTATFNGESVILDPTTAVTGGDEGAYIIIGA